MLCIYSVYGYGYEDGMGRHKHDPTLDGGTKPTLRVNKGLCAVVKTRGTCFVC